MHSPALHPNCQQSSLGTIPAFVGAPRWPHSSYRKQSASQKECRQQGVLRAQQVAENAPSQTAHAPHAASVPEESHDPPVMLQEVIHRMLARYWDRTPAAVTICNLLQALAAEGAPVIFDHIAFRTLQLPGYGIESIGSVFTDLGYKQRDELEFPAKHLRALWFSPPDPNSKLPRIFISELKVHELSGKAQSIIGKYVSRAGSLRGNYSAFCAATGVIPWGPLSSDDYHFLEQESEYAAWTLTHGYQVDHTTVAIHRLPGWKGGLDKVNQELTDRGFPLNLQGGIVKRSPDGGLLQSSTVAERVPIVFTDGSNALLPGAYIEFAERRVLPQFQHLKPEEVKEEHRRDGFEVGNADKIFESTKLAINEPVRQPMAEWT